MGSMLVPGTGSFGNPAGMDAYGLNPLSDLENLKSLASFVPGSDSRQAKILGSSAKTGSPFVNPAPSVAPPMAPTSPFAVASSTGNANTWKPQTPVNAGLNQNAPADVFGYSTDTNNNASLAALENLQPGAGWSPNNMGPMIDPHTRGALEDVYGKGFGRTLSNVLASGAGYNPQVAGAFINAIHPYFQANLNNIMSQFGAAGARFSSSAALSAGQMGASFTAQEQQFMAQMYQWAYQNFLGILTAGAQDKMRHGSGSGIMQAITGGLGLASTGAAGLQAAGVGGAAGSGTVAAILSGLAAL